MNNISPPPLHDPSNEEVEKILKKLPRFTLSSRANKLFYQKLEARIRDHAEYQQKSWFSFGRFAFATGFASLLLVVAGTSWAYQDSVTRGHFMYPWKQQGEKLELTFALNAQTQIDTHLRFSERRMNEAEEIAGGSTFAWLVQEAYAATEMPRLSEEETTYLSLTLKDMRNEVITASRIAEQHPMPSGKAQVVLAKIEATTERHMKALDRIEKKMHPDISTIIHTVIEEEDAQLARVVEAQEDLREAIREKRSEVQLQLIVKEERVTTTRRVRAEQQLEQTRNLFNTLPDKEKESYREQMQRAQNALEQGNTGAAFGVSRALEKRIINPLRDTKNDEKTTRLGEKPQAFDDSKQREPIAPYNGPATIPFEISRPQEVELLDEPVLPIDSTRSSTPPPIQLPRPTEVQTHQSLPIQPIEPTIVPVAPGRSLDTPTPTIRPESVAPLGTERTAPIMPYVQPIRAIDPLRIPNSTDTDRLFVK